MNQTASDVVRCASCGTRNRIPPDRDPEKARCGKCRKPLAGAAEDHRSAEQYTLRCSACRTRNRIPASRVDSEPKCGKCGQVLPTSELFRPQPVMVTDRNFESMVLQSPLPVVVFCWAPWCPTCGTVAPVVDEFARESKGKIRVAKVNVDASPQFASRYEVLSVPYMFIFDNGQLKESFPGGLQKHQLMFKMASYL